MAGQSESLPGTMRLFLLYFLFADSANKNVIPFLQPPNNLDPNSVANTIILSFLSSRVFVYDYERGAKLHLDRGKERHARINTVAGLILSRVCQKCFLED